MIDIKELINDLGGPRAVLSGGVVCIFLLVATDNAISEVTRRLADVEERAESNRHHIEAEIKRIELRVTRLEEFAALGPRVTPRDLQGLDRRLERLEQMVDGNGGIHRNGH